MNTNFIEFKIANCERNIVVNVSKILNFFETKDGKCTIVMSTEESFQVAHKYTDVINMIQYYDTVSVARCS